MFFKVASFFAIMANRTCAIAFGLHNSVVVFRSQPQRRNPLDDFASPRTTC